MRWRSGCEPAPVWGAQLVNRVASFTQPFLILYLTHDHGLSPALAGAVAAGVGVGSVVAALLGGWAADRVGRRATIIAGQVLVSGALLWLALADGLWQLAVAALLVGLGGDVVRPAMSATISDRVPGHLQVRAYGLLFWAVNLGFAVATVSAGLLSRWGFGVLFLVNAAGSLLAGLIILRGLPESRPAVARQPAPFVPVLLRDRPALVLLGAGTLYATVYFQAYTTLPLVMTGQGISPSVYGMVLAVNGIVICVAQPLVLPLLERHRPERVYAAGLLVVGAGFAATSLAGSVLAHVIVLVVWTLGEIAVAGIVGALFSRRAPEALRGRYLSLVTLSFAAGALLGPVVGGSVLQLAGSTVLWLGSGALMVAAAAAVLGGADDGGRS